MSTKANTAIDQSIKGRRPKSGSLALLTKKRPKMRAKMNIFILHLKMELSQERHGKNSSNFCISSSFIDLSLLKPC